MAVYDDRLVHAASEGNRRINWLVHWFSSGIMGEWAYQLVSTSHFLQETGHTDLSVQPKLFVGECSYRAVSETKGFIVKNVFIE